MLHLFVCCFLFLLIDKSVNAIGWIISVIGLLFNTSMKIHIIVLASILEVYRESFNNKKLVVFHHSSQSEVKSLTRAGRELADAFPRFCFFPTDPDRRKTLRFLL